MANPRKATRPGKGSIKKSPPFRLTYLPVNQRWVLTWGEKIIPVSLGDSGPEQRSFESKKEAVAVLKRRGLKVSAAGVVSSTKVSPLFERAHIKRT
jgi:hypothetical protein